MIDVYASTPRIYYDNSRDFQTLGRVFEILLNYAKTGVDLVDNSPFAKDMDAKLLRLLANTLGFDVSRRYDERELRSICSSFIEMMRSKGSIRSIKTAVSAFLSAQQISGSYSVTANEGTVTIDLPVSVTDTTLLEDLLDYVLPSGMFPVFRFSVYGGTGEHRTEVVSMAKAYIYGPFELGLVAISGENDEKPTYDSAQQTLALTFTGVINTPNVTHEQFSVMSGSVEGQYDAFETDDGDIYYVVE